MLLLLLLGVAVLYACFRNDWLLLLLIPILGTYVAGSSVHANVDDASCSKVSSALQKKFPLCWMMSSIGLLNNLIVLHKFEFLHPHVIALINEWKSLPYPSFSTQEASCPLINPKELRSHLWSWHAALNTVEVHIFVNMDEYNAFVEQTPYSCLKSDDQKIAPKSLGSRIKSSINWFYKTRLTDSDKTLGWTPRAHPSIVLRESVDYNASYDDPLVQDYLKGKRWFYQYPVCVTKFTGFGAGDPLMDLVTYKTSYVDSFATQSEQRVWVGKTEEYYICLISNAGALRVDANLLKYDTLPVVVLLQKKLPVTLWSTINNIRADSISGYTILGGVLGLGCQQHAIHFVICDGGIRFIDSNSSNFYYTMEDAMRKYTRYNGYCNDVSIIMVKNSQRKRKRSDEEEEGRRVRQNKN